MTRLVQYPFQKRRATICLNLLAQVTGKNDQDKTDRLRARLRVLILTGLSLFDEWLDAPPAASGCACGREEIREREKRGGTKAFEFGRNECSKTKEGECGVESFLADRAPDCAVILSYLSQLPVEKKTKELQQAENFLKTIEANPQKARELNPYLKVGDLIIALESAAVGAKVFYTMNGKESQHLCRPLGQTLIVSPPDSLMADIVCDRTDASNWHDFG
jgi:hypothetical protein